MKTLKDFLFESDLSSSKRDSLPKSDFGIPSEKKYPMPDREHAGNAKARAKQELNAGRLSKDEYDKIVSKANKILSGQH